MKKYAAALLSVLLFCGCSNTIPKESNDNEKVEVNQAKLENMTALYTGLAEANETIDNKSKIGVWAYYEDGTKEFITQGWTVKDPVTLEAGKKLTYTGKIIARVDYKGIRGYMINIFDDKSRVSVLDFNKEFDFKEGQTVTFWAYGLGRVETKGLFGKERSCIAFKAKYMEEA